MTIKQYGGVFGRNPKFNNVEAESLSIAGNAVPDASTILVDGDIGSTVQGYDADTAKYDDTTANFTGTLQNGGSNVLVDTDIGSTVQGYDADTAKLDAAQTFTETQTFNENIVMASTKGIDFSATGDGSGTTSSELFDDYEEGTWTPEYTSAGGAFTATYDIQEGYYTKVGRQVTVYGIMRTDSLSGGSGTVRIAGLPFTASSSGNSGRSSGAISTCSDFAGDMPNALNTASGSNQIFLLYRTASNVNALGLDVSDLGTGANSNFVGFSVTYFV